MLTTDRRCSTPHWRDCHNRCPAWSDCPDERRTQDQGIDRPTGTRSQGLAWQQLPRGPQTRPTAQNQRHRALVPSLSLFKYVYAAQNAIHVIQRRARVQGHRCAAPSSGCARDLRPRTACPSSMRPSAAAQSRLAAQNGHVATQGVRPAPRPATVNFQTRGSPESFPFLRACCALISPRFPEISGLAAAEIAQPAGLFWLQRFQTWRRRPDHR